MKFIKEKNTNILLSNSFIELYSEEYESMLVNQKNYKQDRNTTPDRLDAGELEWKYNTNDVEEAKEAFEGMMLMQPPKKFKLNKSRAEDAGRTTTVKRRRKRKNEFDGEFDLDAVMSGDPRYYTKTTKVKRKDKMISILINLSASASVKSSVIQKKLVTVIEQIDAYHNMGMQMEIAIIMPLKGLYSGSNKLAINGLFVHKAGQAYNKNKLYVVLHTHILRTALFRMCYANAEMSKEVAGFGLGQPIHNEMNKDKLNQILDDYKKVVNTDFVYFDLFGGVIK